MASQVKNGKAFEWSVGKAIAEQTGFKIQMDSTAKNNKSCFDSHDIKKKQRENYVQSATLAVEHILLKENLEESGIIRFLPDEAGKKGDVRDIVIVTENKLIGISCKTNHEAYKHSRLSRRLDFVKKWNLHPDGCSQTYFNTITPLFDELASIRTKSKREEKWVNLKNVPDRFYWPLLHAFEAEIKRVHSPEMCKNFIKYLVGKNDFYKVVSKHKSVSIQAFNLDGTLNVIKPQLPTKIDHIKDKNSSQYSKTIMFDKGWTFSFRIHNASSRVEASLKFDVQAISLSPKIYTHHIDY